MKKTVFLSGPMRGVSRDKSLEWRNDAKNKLVNVFNVIHALRGREKKETMPSQKSAVIRDLYDINHSDILLVNDTFENVSMIGTAMEIYVAYTSNMPVIVFGNAHKGDYWMDYHSHVRVETLDDACKVLKELFL
ncbi:MAG TPA: hypothetical protein P5323_01865 [Candidatus Moranbacteria bacterium]|nr:hypothetical protein [Candidatus Moranbacteria bacterium]HSA08426.1 hypothetical protein [Candidatus Moranbacteria bacterium]